MATPYGVPERLDRARLCLRLLEQEGHDAGVRGVDAALHVEQREQQPPQCALQRDDGAAGQAAPRADGYRSEVERSVQVSGVARKPCRERLCRGLLRRRERWRWWRSDVRLAHTWCRGGV
jgi:hypothetical protein